MAFVVIGGDIWPLRASLSEASRLSNGVANDLTRGFEDAALKGRALSDVLRSLALSLSKHALIQRCRLSRTLSANTLVQLLGGGTRIPSRHCRLPKAASLPRQSRFRSAAGVSPAGGGAGSRSCRWRAVRSAGSACEATGAAAGARDIQCDNATRRAFAARRPIAAMLNRVVGRGTGTYKPRPFTTCASRPPSRLAQRGAHSGAPKSCARLRP